MRLSSFDDSQLLQIWSFLRNAKESNCDILIPRKSVHCVDAVLPTLGGVLIVMFQDKP